jgi:hypothetical protein
MEKPYKCPSRDLGRIFIQNGGQVKTSDRAIR